MKPNVPPVQKSNRLAHEASPYLLQHAHNPVDWYPWGPEALAASKREGKPIFLSIGYSACHWCHVMERESFEDPATAELMNRHFINIKVDREERPDLDQIYMNAVMLMTQHGGWPMSVWLTPDLKPFYGGTYFPPVRRFNMPAFSEIIENLAQAWRDRRSEIDAAATDMTGHLLRMGSVEPVEGELTVQLIESAGRAIERIIDARWGGLGRAPKFPHSVEMRLLLRAAKRTGNETMTEHAVFSLEKMITGGIFDQLGGGYHRYSTDERWLVPHFEKMLYDNVLISLANVEAWQVTKRPIFKDATIATLDYVLREMRDEAGGFYSAQDADSEGVEGKFFVWSKAEIVAALGEEEGEVFCYCYDVSEHGNWEESNILNRPKSTEQCCKLLKLEPARLEEILARGRKMLLDIRSKRVPPATDTKVLTSWNAMAIDALAFAGSVFDRSDYIVAASEAATFVLETMHDGEGRLLRVFKSGVGAKLNAYLEDYAYLANALVTLYEATFETKWIEAALKLVDALFARFWDDAAGGFFYTSNDHETLIARGKDPADGAIPSGNSMAVTALARLWHLTGRQNLADRAESTFQLFRGQMEQSPTGSAQMLIALGVFLGPTKEIAIVGDLTNPETQAMLKAVHVPFMPDKVLAAGEPDALDSAGRVLGLLAGKKPNANGLPSAFVCSEFVCSTPVNTVADFKAQIAKS